MFEIPQPTQQREDLQYQALLYAAGELNPAAAETFEARLGSDADAQQALVQVVQLAGLVDGRSYIPDPAYRSAVRQVVLAERRSWHRRLATWLALSGACAAAIALIATGISAKQTLVGNAPSVSPHSEVAQSNSAPLVVTPAVPQIAESAPNPTPGLLAKQPDDAAAANDTEDTVGAANWSEFANPVWLHKYLLDQQRRQLRLLANDLNIEQLPPPPELLE